MLLPCQVVMMLAVMFVAYQHSAGLESEFLNRGHGDAGTLDNYGRTEAFA